MNLLDYHKLAGRGYAPDKPWFYISGSLTVISTHQKEELENLYEDIAALVGRLGGFAYLPHRGGTDPVRNPDITFSDVYETDMAAVAKAKSGAVIAYVGEPAIGTGMELQEAARLGIPVILLAEKGRKVTRLAKGIPTLKAMVLFDSPQEALAQLEPVIKEILGGHK